MVLLPTQEGRGRILHGQLCPGGSGRFRAAGLELGQPLLWLPAWAPGSFAARGSGDWRRWR